VKILVVRSISRKGLMQSGILRDFTPGFQRASFVKMIKSDLHGDMQEELYGELFARGAMARRS
jgi:hypothetical protein